MGRPKGGTNKKWRKEEKLRIVNRNLIDHIGYTVLSKEEGLSKGMLWNWISAFQERGEKGLEPQKHIGNNFAALHTSKNLSELDRLKLENARQRV